jgi:flagellar basal-body rod protein FlgG
MVPQQSRLEALTNNIANANTAGFKRISVFERSLIDVRENLNNIRGDVEQDDTPSTSYTDFRRGAAERTGNPFDFAIDSEKGFFVLHDQNGNQFYTRSGHFQLGQDGKLETADGLTLMGDNGPIMVQQQGGISNSGGDQSYTDTRSLNVVMRESGDVFVNEQLVGRVQLMDIRNPETLKRETGAHFSATDKTEYEPVPMEQTRLKQGYLEQSNVNIIKEMVEMIELQRLFELGQKVITTNDSTLDKSIDLSRYS